MACAAFVALAPAAGAVETMAVAAEVVGKTPMALGYNLGHFLDGSNAADWFRYSGVDSARMFVGVSDIEPEDDLPTAGDGVTDETSFFARRALLRANAADAGAPLSPAYVKWESFSTNLAKPSSGNNKLSYGHVLGTLRDTGVDVLVNLSASPGHFPLAGPDDWVGLHQMQFLGNPTILAMCLTLPCLPASARAETYDARVDGTQILTPPSGPAPAINGPEVYGVRPGSPVIYRIPTTGRRPIRFTTKDLPDTLHIDQPCRMRDLWRRKDAGTVADKLTVRVGPRGCAVLRLAAAKTTEP